MPTDFPLDQICAGLPAAALLNELQAACSVTVGSNAVIVAPPGTGKTTVIPPALANIRPGRVIVTQPRRIAASAAAARLAQLTGTDLGDLVGYSVRGDRRCGPQTRIEFVTDGLLVRRLLHDPEFSGVHTVVLDEIHERSVESDLVAGMLGEVSMLRDDLVVVAMSATADHERWAEHFNAPVLTADAPLHPVDISWRPFTGHRLDAHGCRGEFLDHVAQMSVDAYSQVQQFGAGSRVLTFVPGVREAEHVARSVREAGIEASSLHGSLTLREQAAVLEQRSDGASVIVATGIAESSLTVPGVRGVVDAGLAREPRIDVARGLPELVTVATSKASAVQRAGRAGRLGPGLVVRCYDHTTWGAMPSHPLPQIATGDFTPAALTLAAWHGSECDLSLLPEAPPAPLVSAALEELSALGALRDNKLTDLGKSLSEVAAHPRLARALLLGANEVGAERAAELVAVLASDERAPNGDLTVLVQSLRRGGTAAAARWRSDVATFTRTVTKGSGRLAQDVPTAPIRSSEVAMGIITALAFPDRLARRRESPDTNGRAEYLFVSGIGARCDQGALAQSEWLAVAHVQGTAHGNRIRAAAPISEQDATELGAPLRSKQTITSWHGTQLRARQSERLGAITLTETPIAATPTDAIRAVRERITTEGVAWLPWPDSATQLRRRLALLYRIVGTPWPDVSDRALADSLEQWFGIELDAISRGERIDALDFSEPYRRLLPWPEASRLDELVPVRLEVPSGNRIAIDYPEVDSDAPPVLAVKLQECFGMTQTPSIVDGRVPLLCHLLSPAGRPLAVTADLASFWNGPYAQVRAEMRGRYPKHPWPENPLTATATHLTTARLQQRKP